MAFSALSSVSLLLLSSSPFLVQHVRASPSMPRPTPAPDWQRNGTAAHELELFRRQGILTELSTCGYFSGDPTKPRTANPGFNCRYDTANALWGFCPTTVILASDCGLAGNCIDSFTCSKGCGKTGIPGLTTFTCSGTQLCSTAIVTLAVDAVLSYIACGAAAVTDHLLISPTAPAAAPSTVLTSVPVPPASGKQPPINSGSRVVSGLPQSPSETVIGGTLAVGPSSSTSPAANGTIDRAAGSNGGNMGMIVGGVVGCLAVVGLSVIGVIYLLRRRTITTASDRSHERPATATPRRFSYWPSTTRTRPLAPFFSADSGIGGGQEVKKTAVAEMYAEYPRDESRDPWARKYGAGNYDRYRNSSRELARGPAELPS